MYILNIMFLIFIRIIWLKYMYWFVNIIQRTICKSIKILIRIFNTLRATIDDVQAVTIEYFLGLKIIHQKNVFS